MRLTEQINKSDFLGLHDATDNEVWQALQYSCVVQEVAKQVLFLRDLRKTAGKDIGK